MRNCRWCVHQPFQSALSAVYRGKYLFQESCNSWLNILDLSGPAAVRSPFATQVHNNSLGLMTEIDGYMYYLHRGGGALYKMVYNGAITTNNHKSSCKCQRCCRTAGYLFCHCVGTPPLAYQWQKNGANISGATSATFHISQCALANAGNYRVIVTNGNGSVTSNAAALTVVNNALPTAEILTPTTDANIRRRHDYKFLGPGN